MKKILLINTKYREFGGEDSNFIEEYEFLSKNFEEIEYHLGQPCKNEYWLILSEGTHPLFFYLKPE